MGEKRWLRERGTDAYCPYEQEGEHVIVVTGLTFLGAPDEPVDGEFWYDGQGDIQVRLEP